MGKTQATNIYGGGDKNTPPRPSHECDRGTPIRSDRKQSRSRNDYDRGAGSSISEKP